MKIIKNEEALSPVKKVKRELNKREEVLYNFFQQNLSDLSKKIESALDKGAVHKKQSK